MNNKTILGIDMGGTNIRAGLVNEHKIKSITSRRVDGKGSMEKVLQDVFNLTDNLIDSSVNSIGIGVPGLVDLEQGLVYDAVYIPSWKKVPLKKLMEERYHLPVLINNDANCFALGEFYFGKGKGVNAMIGLTIGTGLGSGIIINKKLYAGKNCGAGEFGMVDYLDKCYEYYASGQFFQNVYQMDGEVVFNLAAKADNRAIKMYEEIGMHLGNAIRMIMYTMDVELIILGGSVRHAWPYFSKSMWQQIKTFAFKRSIEHLKIEISELENSGILGAAALHYDFI
jgi:glucokinase